MHGEVDTPAASVAHDATASLPPTCQEGPAARPARAALSGRLRERIARDFHGRLREEWGGRFVTHGRSPGPQAVRLDGNDYLSLSGHERIVRAQIDSLRRDRDIVVQSGVFHLEDSPTHRLEQALAAHVDAEGALLCQSGYAANVGLLQVIADADTPVYIDNLAHMSLWEGIRAAGATARPFRHNDPAFLARAMRRHGPGIVVVDTVYSITGAVCPLREIIEVAEAHGSMVVADESHSLGTHGAQGRGLCAQLGLSHRVHFITASLAKAFAGRGGFLTLPQELRYYLMCHSFPSIFSSALLPHEIEGLRATLDVVREADGARSRLRAVTARVRSRLAALGYPVANGTEQIVGLEVGLEADTLALRDAMEARGVFGAVFVAPATPRDRSVLRMTLHADLTEAEIAHVERVATELAPAFRPWDWASARRQGTQAGASVLAASASA